MPSSVIRRFHYDSEMRELLIEFVTGRRYVYAAVPQSTVDDFRAAFSKGIFFNTRIRDAFDCREIARAEVETES